MELLLWRWLGATLFFWYFEPPASLFALVRIFYMAGKTAFVLLLIHGGWTLKRPGDWLAPPRFAVLAVIGYAIAGGVFATSIPRLGLIQHLVMGTMLAAGAFRLLEKPREPGLSWLAAGLLLRGGLSLCEAAAYGLRLVRPAAVAPFVAAAAGTFLAASSSFDSGAEWLLALGGVLALSARIQGELRQSNAGLVTAQEDLRRVADRGPLTGLANRRQLPETFRAVQPQGALLLFFDLDDFKEINDCYGHQAGGRERVGRLRDRLRFVPGAGPPVTFSVGLSRLAPGGQPDEAVRAADESMYAAKADRLRRPTAAGGRS